MKGLAALALLPLLASTSPVFKVGTIHNDAAPILSSAQSKEIPDSYIVVFKKHVSHSSADLHLNTQDTKTELRKRSQLPISTDIFGGLRHTFNIAGGLVGYSGHFDEDVIERVRRHPDVSSSRSPSLVSSFNYAHVILDVRPTQPEADLLRSRSGGLYREGL